MRHIIYIYNLCSIFFFFFSSRRRHTRCSRDWSSDVCSSDLKDELQFQVVHQVEELWMKLIAYTLLDIEEYMAARNTNRILTLFKRVHMEIGRASCRERV